MSTISKNPFALLSGGDSDDEGGAIGSVPVKATKAPIQAVPQPKKTIPGQQVKRDRGDYPTRGAPRKVYGTQSGGGGGEGEIIGDKPAGTTDQGRDDRAERRGGHRGGRGARGRGGRGRGGGRFDDRPDRHSATGTHDTDRKVASGWGAEEGKQELQAENDGWGDAKAAAAEGDDTSGAHAGGDGTAPIANGHAKGAEWEESKEEEEDKTKTFEEYLAEKANSLSALPSLKKDVRKPNEGADDSQWKNAVKLVKGEEEEEVFFQANKEKKSSQGQSNKKNKEKTFIEVEPAGYRPPRAGGDRGGRGRGGRGDRDGQDRREFHDNRGPRGGRGRGGPRGPKEFNAEDANAFPSLS